MASRKSSRVKKSPVVYQAPEPTHRAPRNVTPKQAPPRRMFSRDIELQMECMDDELSPAQLKAIKEAQREHEKANDLIKEVRAGNILVPSSQPNTFTIVPPKPSPTQPPPAATIPVIQSSVMKSVSPPVESTVPRGLPPPRPAQFLNKQLQEMNKTPARSTSDVILISDTPPMSGITKVPVSQVSTSPMQIQQMTAVIPSQGVSATPQQVYKFVSVPSNMPTNVVQNQWALRPLLTVSPQQQQQQQQQPQLSFLSPTQFTPVRTVSLPQGTVAMPAPKSTGISGKKLGVGDRSAGEELVRGGVTIPKGRRDGKKNGTEFPKSYLKQDSIDRNENKVGCCFQGAELKNEIGIGTKSSERTHCISSPVYSWKVRLHCVKISVLLDAGKARQAYKNFQVELTVWSYLYKNWLKNNVRLRTEESESVRSNDSENDSNVESNSLTNLNENSADKKKFQVCDKIKCANQNSLSNCKKGNEYRNTKIHAHNICDKEGNNCDPETSMGLAQSEKNDQIRKCKKSSYSQKKQDYNAVKHMRNCKIQSYLLKTQQFGTVVFSKKYLPEDAVSEKTYSYSKNFRCAFDKQCEIRIDKTEEYDRDGEKIEFINSNDAVGDYSDNSTIKNIVFHNLNRHPSQRSQTGTSTSRPALQEIKNRLNPQACCLRRKKYCEMNQKNARGRRNRLRKTVRDKENITRFARQTSQGHSKDFRKSLWSKKYIAHDNLYEVVNKGTVDRNFGIVNMIYEYTRCTLNDNATSDTNPSSVRVDECLSVGENQHLYFRENDRDFAKKTDFSKVTDTSYSKGTDPNEKHQCTLVDATVKGYSNSSVDITFGEKSKQICSSVGRECSVTEQSFTMIREDNLKDTEEINTTKELAEVNGNIVSCEDLNENSKAGIYEKKVKMAGDSFMKMTDCYNKSSSSANCAEINNQTYKYISNNLDTEDIDSECTLEMSSDEEEMESFKKESESFSSFQISAADKWYHTMSDMDALYITMLCRQFGFTKMSKDLQIPKTFLLKLRRHVRKSKNVASKDGFQENSHKVLNAPNTNEDGNVTAVMSNDSETKKISYLERYHPQLYMTAQRLLEQDNARQSDDLCYLRNDSNEGSHLDIKECRSSSTKDKIHQCSQENDVSRQEADADSKTDQNVVYNNTEMKREQNTKYKDNSECDCVSFSGLYDLVIDCAYRQSKIDDNESSIQPVNLKHEHMIQNAETSSQTCVGNIEESDGLEVIISDSQNCVLRNIMQSTQKIEKNGRKSHDDQTDLSSKDKDRSVFACSHDHCYQKMHMFDRDRDVKDGRTEAENLFDVENDQFYDREIEVYLSGSKCFDHEGAWEEIEGRKVKVYSPLSVEKQKEILEFVSKFSINTAASHFNIPAEHVNALVYHTNSHSRKLEHSHHQLTQGIPTKYKSSSSLDGKYSNFCYQGGQFEDNANTEHVSEESKAVESSDDLNANKENKLDVEYVVDIESNGGSSEELTENAGIDSGNADIEHPVYTKDFIKYAIENKLLKNKDKYVSTQQKIAEITRVLESVDMNTGVRSFTNKNGKILHRYSPEFQRSMLVLASKVGSKTVSETFSLRIETLYSWKVRLRKAIKMNRKIDSRYADKQLPKNIRDDDFQVRKRIRFSKELKIKLVHLCKSVGLAEVMKLFNLSRKSLQNWVREFEDETLPDYEISSEELEALKEHNAYKTEVLEKMRRKTCEDDCRSNGKSKPLSYREHKDGGENPRHKINRAEVIKEKNRKGENSSDKNLHMTFPNNMEVILDIDDDSEENSEFHDQYELYKSSDKDETDVFDSLISNEKLSDSFDIIETNGSKQNDENFTKDQFFAQNLNNMKAMKNQACLNESDTEDVIEIVSWHVNPERSCSGYVSKQEAQISGESSCDEEKIYILKQNCEVGFKHLIEDSDSHKDSSNKNEDQTQEEKQEYFVDLKSCAKNDKKDEKEDTGKISLSQTASKESKEETTNTKIEQMTNKNQPESCHVRTLSFETSECTTTNKKAFDEGDSTKNSGSEQFLASHCPVDAKDGDVIYISDSEDSINSLPSKIMNISDIKEEPYDDEFDEIENGKRFRNLKKDQISRDENFAKESINRQGRRRQPHTGLDGSDCITEDTEKAGSKPYEIHQLGIGDGNRSQNQGYNFNSSSGNSSSNSQGTAPSSVAGSSGSSNFNVNSLTASGTNIQIVGTQDLIPGQEYILVDPRLFSSAASTFQTIRPPALLRPQIRQQINTTDVVVPRPQISLANIVSSGVPTPVHVVENRSVRLNKPSNLAKMNVITPPAPRLTFFGNPGSSREVQDRRIITESAAVRSLLKGSGLQGKNNVHTSPNMKVSDKRNTSPGRRITSISQNASTSLPVESGKNTSAGGDIVYVSPKPRNDTSQAGNSINVSPTSNSDKQEAGRRTLSLVGHVQVVPQNSGLKVSPQKPDNTKITTGTIKTVSSSVDVTEKKMSLTLKGMGSISSEIVAVPGTSGTINQLPVTKENDQKHDMSVSEPQKTKVFRKSLPVSGSLEKERKLLEALLLQKSGQKTQSSTTDVAGSVPLDKSADATKQMQSSNRIDSLIQKMNDRFQKSSDDFEFKNSLSVIGKQPPKISEVDVVGHPSSASQILFGEYSSPKKKEVKTVENTSCESSAESSQAEISLFVKKDQRKTALVVREVDSTEDETSSGSSTLSGSNEESSSSASSNDAQVCDLKDGRIEQVDLGAKLKSLLSADIFNVIEPQKHSVEDDDDLIEILSKPTDKKVEPGSSIKTKENDCDAEITKKKNIDAEANEERNVPMMKGGINYSINIKKKLGKLASMFSIVSLSKKYGLNASTLGRWKAKYQDEEIAGLQLTEAELKELEEVNNLKKLLYGSSEPAYDIYVDNPEEGDDEIVSESIDLKEKNEKIFPKSSVVHSEWSTRIKENDQLKSKTSEDLISKPESNDPTFNKAKGSTYCKDTMKLGTPLYITVENDAPEEIKQQIRRKMKTQESAEEAWTNGAFLKTAKSSLASVFGHDEVKVDGKVLTKSSDTDSASEKENEKELPLQKSVQKKSLQREDLKEKVFEAKATDADKVTWEKTVYLCPDEGIFKYRYEMKKINNTSSNVPEPNENKTQSVLDSLFKTPSMLPVSTVRGNLSEPLLTSDKTGENLNTSTSPSGIAKMLKETPRTASITHSANLDDSEKPFKPLNERSLMKEEKQGSSLTHAFSEDFKWTVVKEARLSGFENTAKLYSISMTDIMKWHDNFLNERKSKDLDDKRNRSDCSTESISSVVDLSADENPHCMLEDPDIHGKDRLGRLNANLSFERIKVKEGTITKPRFSSKSPTSPLNPSPSLTLASSSRPQRTRMGPNSIKYATPKVNSEQLEKFQADVEGDLGIMPKIMKKSKGKQEGIEIASTWKQVQSVLNPNKTTEKKYSQEYKNKIIRECEQKGQKTVALEHRIPYNEISRWRLEAKKLNLMGPGKKVTSVNDEVQSISLVSEGPKKAANIEKVGGNEQESLKIKIKLSSLSQAATSSLSNKKKEADSRSVNRVGLETSSASAKMLLDTEKRPENIVRNSSSVSGGSQDSEKNASKHAARTEKARSSDKSEPVSIDEDVDLRMEVINFCFEHGVLKTQKKFNVTRQSIIDLMKEYDELNKYEVDSYNKSQRLHSLKTRLISREKTSVEVTNTATRPVIVKNLNDYIVTQEYMQTVVDYALKHGITAATRKYKRKTNTVRSWMNQFQREVKKKISVEQVAKEQELLAKNMSIEEARKISNLEARKKKQLLEAEFRRHIVEFAREFGITAASRRFKKKAATVKSWMGHFMKGERDAKRLEEAEAKRKQAVDKELDKFPKACSPKVSVNQDSVTQKSPIPAKHKTPPQSPIWEQDFVIKPTSSKSPLKLTFSPRRKSSPIILIGSDTEEDNVDDEKNDIETDDEQENISGDYLEVATWDINSSGSRSESSLSKAKLESAKDDQQSVEKTSHTVIDILSDDEENKSTADKTPTEKDRPAESTADSQKIIGGDMDTTFTSRKQAKCEQAKSEFAHEDVLITLNDVPNILDSDDKPSVNEPNIDEQFTKKDISAQGDLLDSLTEEKLKETESTGQTENKLCRTETSVEDVAMKTPYEETVMFKLLTDEVDNFIKDDTLVVKYKDIETGKNKSEEKPVVQNDKDGKLGPLKKFKKYADAEIVQNIEETYLFTGSRITRHAAFKDAEENIQENVTDQMQEITGNSETGEQNNFLEQKKANNLKGAINYSENDKQIQQGVSKRMGFSGIQSSEQIDKVSEEGHDSKMDFEIKDAEKNQLRLMDSDVQKKPERSLFDVLVSESEKTADVQVDANSDEQESSSFSLFGNLIKNLTVPQSVGVTNSENITMETVSTFDQKETGSPEKSVELNKDRSERNLFDFIGLEPESSPLPQNNPPAHVQSPRIKTRSLSKADISPVKSKQDCSSVKIHPVKKPMFKFPKLASPINFGNIFKLGIAKIKEDEKAKGEQECRIEEATVSKVAIVEEKHQEERIAKKIIQDKIKDRNEIEEDKNEVVMETFEELRQRLAKERAAQKLEKEKAKAVVLGMNAKDIDEIDGSREACSQSDEIEDEMYKEFTPQKIVLILDISKKHGIEFASSSFGLPVSVIVNWIFEKDRKQRKVALSVSLEEKLKALKDIKDGIVSKEQIKEHHSIDNITFGKWESEAGWLLENKKVYDVLEKWQKVESVSNLNFEEPLKTLERKDSVSEKERSENDDQTHDREENKKTVEADNDGQASDDEVLITMVEKQADRKDNAELVSESTPEEGSNNENSQIDLPDILSFVKTTKPRDFTTEQKAMFVLLVQKYGSLTISKKFGVNSGTLYNWKHTSKPVRQYLYEQTGSKTYMDGKNSGEAGTRNVPVENQIDVVNDVPFRETRSKGNQKQIVPSDKTSEEAVSIKTTHDVTKSLENKSMNEDLSGNPKGYRIISPTKLPPVLRGVKKHHTKDYTLEQRVAIVKLVQLYGVRTIHKQFNIHAGTIWNWQHAKNVVEVLRKENQDVKGAQKELDFDIGEEEVEPLSIDTILDRVLVASESVNHLNFQQDRKADVVCLINHFGIDYVCEKVPQIPRGTLWNWRHNRHVIALVEERNKQIQKFEDLLNKRKRKNLRENVVGEAIDKTDLTQKWLKDLQNNAGEGKDSLNVRDSSVERVKRKRTFEDKVGNQSKKPKLGPMSYKKNLPVEKSRSLSPSSISSEISVHSYEFEEILSDDEVNTPSVLSRRSGTSTQTTHSNKTVSVQRTSTGRQESGLSSKFSSLDTDKANETSVPDYEVLKSEIGSDDRMMVCYRVLENKDASATQLVKSTELVGKRPAMSEPSSAQPPAKKKNPKITEVPDQSGNWVPLDEYYYGTHEGDVSYTEEKGEYRFKCWYCSKMLYNNIRAMQHIQGHIDASKQQNIDLSDLTQCKHCYKQFDTPFEMQTHVEKVHLSNKVLMCRICEKDFATPRELMTHMKGNHHACEMPYVCHLCNFRSSMYSDVVDHFKKKHDSSHFMLCLYCLRTFEVKFVSQGWGQTQTYYGHLLKHQSKSATKKCVVCRLTFFNAMDVKTHRKTCHVTSLQDMKALSQGGKSDIEHKQKNRSTLKSLNAPSISRIQDYGDITFPAETTKSKCIECKMMMSSTDHYKKYVHCTMCRFATSCSVAYANHMMGFHSGQMSSLNLNIPWERPMKDVMYCTCSFSSKYGNKVANHLVYCAKWTCSSTKQSPSSSTPGKTGDEVKEGSLLGMLGLVQKSAVATKIRTVSKTKTDPKPDVIVIDKSEKDTSNSIIDTKPEDKNVQNVSESSVLESTGQIPDADDGKTLPLAMETSEVITKETVKIKEKVDTDSVSKKFSVEVSKTVVEESTQGGKAIDNKEGGKEDKTENSRIEDSQKNEDVTKKHDAENEKELNDNIKDEELNDSEKDKETESILQSSKLASDANAESSRVPEQEDTDLREHVLDKEAVSETTTASEHPRSEAVAQTKLPPAHNKPESDTDTKDDDLKGDGEVEMIKEKAEDEEIDMETDAVESVKESQKLEDKSSDFKDLSAKLEDTSRDEEEVQLEQDTEMPQNEGEKDIKDEITTSEAKNESKSGAGGETLKEKEEDTKTEGQDMELAQEKVEDLDVDQEESIIKDQQDVEDGKSRSSPSSQDPADHGDSSKGISTDGSRESSEHRASGDDRARMGRESSERHQSGSGDWSKPEDRSHEDDRQYHDNRSHGSSRSESHHGNRSSYERDRSHDRDRDRDRDSRERDRGRDSRERDRDRNRERDRNRDRDYNRNRDYRHGDRSGYSYQDNRGQGYSGGGGYRGPQGQYGGYQGNRGDQYQDRNRDGYHDRNYNRNHQNRGGYNPNYRGGYRGGYY